MSEESEGYNLAKAVMQEAVDKGYADITDENWNPDAHINITLTVAEIRLAAKIIGYEGRRDDE